MVSAHRDALKAKVEAAGGNVAFGDGPATYKPAADQAGMIAQGEKVGIMADETVDADIRSLRELLVYGIKGLAAYADHARILGQEDDAIYAFIYEAMAATLDNSKGVNDYVGLA
jgi:hydroxylamine reductase